MLGSDSDEDDSLIDSDDDSEDMLCDDSSSDDAADELSVVDFDSSELSDLDS